MQRTVDDDALLAALQLADSAFPSGAYTLSQGLETLVEDGVVADVGHPILARGRVRYVGEPIALVAAASRAEAEDAVELVHVEYEPLPVVLDARRAAELPPVVTLRGSSV
jgi:CO/xanthine dehydrogenase Mo-binding subunit